MIGRLCIGTSNLVQKPVNISCHGAVSYFNSLVQALKILMRSRWESGPAHSLECASRLQLLKAYQSVRNFQSFQ
jgi:hypothetical protein